MKKLSMIHLGECVRRGKRKIVKVVKRKPMIEVFVTKTLQFRARIYPSGKPWYDVTIGGVSWRAGKGREFEDKIFKKIIVMMARLNTRFDKLNIIGE